MIAHYLLCVAIWFAAILAAEALMRESPQKTDGQYVAHMQEGLKGLKTADYRHAVVIAVIVTTVWFLVTLAWP